jgi:hypothetical protein
MIFGTGMLLGAFVRPNSTMLLNVLAFREGTAPVSVQCTFIGNFETIGAGGGVTTYGQSANNGFSHGARLGCSIFDTQGEPFDSVWGTWRTTSKESVAACRERWKQLGATEQGIAEYCAER